MEHINVFIGMGAADEENFTETLKGVNQGKDDGEEHRVPHLWGGDVVELLPAGGTVQIGGRVLLLRDGDKPGQQQDNTVAAVFPEIEQQHHTKRRRPAQPVYQRQAQGIGNAGNQAGIRKEQLHQDDRAHHRHDVGKQEHGLEQFVLVGVFLHEQGNGVGQHHDGWQSRRQKAHGVAEGQGEHIVCGYVLIVYEAYEIEGVAAAS